MKRALIFLVATSCYNPTFPQGILCSAEGECPDGQVCAADNRCYDRDMVPDNANAALESLAVSRGQLDPPFDPEVTEYALVLPLGASDLVVTPTAAVPDGVDIEVAGQPVASGSASAGVALDLGDNAIDVVVTPATGEPRTYSIAATRGPGIAQQVYAKASNTDGGDGFGGSVALSGDTLAVGAPQEASGVVGDEGDNSAAAAGAVYIFVRQGTSWSQQAYLKASNVGGGDNFGAAVALDGDTLAVGARGEDSAANGVGGDQTDDSASNAGAVYVFSRSGTSWTQDAYIKASNSGATDGFGGAVALDGDTLAVGASGEDSAASGVDGDETDDSLSGAGAVYVFTRSGALWTKQAYIKASNPEANDFFGNSVDISGDTLAIGASGEDSDATGVDGDETNNDAADSGAVYVFVRSGSDWSQQAYVKASNTQMGDQFGAGSVAVDGDTLAVGARAEESGAAGIDGNQADNGAFRAGAVYVYHRDGAAWSQQAYVKASNTNAGDEFGAVVALSGDVLVVSADGESSGATGVGGDQSDNGTNAAGAAYVFGRVGDTWSQLAYLKASNAGFQDFLGEVGLAVDGDTVAVSSVAEASSATGVGGGAAAQNDNSASGAGAVYVFQ